MKKQVKREIVISQQTEKTEGINPIGVLVKTRRLLGDDGTPVSTKIGALILGEQILEDLKNQIKDLSEQLETTTYEDILKALIEEGVLHSEDEVPVFTVINKKGEKVTKALTTTTTKSLNMDAFKEAIKDPDVFKALPEEFKKTDIQGKPFFTSLYKAGKLGPVYEGYFSMEDSIKNTLKTIKLKGGEE